MINHVVILFLIYINFIIPVLNDNADELYINGSFIRRARSDLTCLHSIHYLYINGFTHPVRRTMPGLD